MFDNQYVVRDDGGWHQRKEDAHETRQMREERRELVVDPLLDLPEYDNEPEDPDCECVQMDVDYWDSSHCPAHGPQSDNARRLRALEAEDEAAAAAKIPWLLGEDWE